MTSLMNRLSNFRFLRSALNAWHPKKEDELPSPFFHTEDINAVHEYFSACKLELGDLPDLTPKVNGFCFICSATVDFRVDPSPDGGPVNWRETLVCPQCNLINRWRGCLHLFEDLCEPTLKDRIYLTETLSPVYQQLVGRFPLLSASEFLPHADLGSIVQTNAVPVRNEDITQLTFDDCSFESVLCFDVLEHVPDYRSALREFFRVLSSGGRLVLSVPFSFKHETLVRAELDETGNVHHLVEPCYHGDPLSDQGVLSYYDFGMELLDEMKQAGFQETSLVCYCSKQWGYLHDNIAFVGRKL
jgi:SAM-dependent methyltransferase